MVRAFNPIHWSAALVVTGLFASGLRAGDAEVPVVKNKIEFAAEPFAQADVRLLDGPFKDASDRGQAYLLKVEPDRLLAGFREQAGLKPRAPRYPGWESAGVAGHCLGHYLSAVSMAYASTGNEEFKKRAVYIVAELAEVQAANKSGYASAIPDGKRIFAEIARGDVRSQGFDLNGSWVPWYTTHKVMAGVVDAYRLAGVKAARPVLSKMCDWAIDTTKKLTDEQWQIMLRCEQGGMNEVLAEAYALTGEKKYLALSEKFTHKAIVDPLVAGRDELAGKHANTQVPKMVGSARQYELTGDKDRAKAASFFWDTVVKNHTYVTGGNSDGEHFGAPGKLAARLGSSTTETCNTNNMLKLTGHLFEWSADPKYAEFYERGVINHILASQDPNTGQVTYYCTLRPGATREYQSLFESFTCCVGTGMENHVRYNQEIYYHKGDTLFVNQFIASRLDWADKGVTLTQTTGFPEAQATALRVQVKRPTAFTLKIRYPKWATQGIELSINGRVQTISADPGSYIELTREWNDGDTIEYAFPMAVRSESMPDKADRVALLFGPIVLAGKLGDGQRERLPVLVAPADRLTSEVKPVNGEMLTFKTEGLARPSDVTLVPYYKAHRFPATVFFDRFTADQWTAREAQYRAEQEQQEKLAARTIDTFAIAEMQPERDHNLTGERTNVGENMGRKWRDARDGGSFSFDVKVAPDQRQQFVITYWGSDADHREFDILVDGVKLASENLTGASPDKFVDKAYDLPEAMYEGKEKVRVTIQARPKNTAGGIFGFRVVKAEGE